MAKRGDPQASPSPAPSASLGRPSLSENSHRILLVFSSTARCGSGSAPGTLAPPSLPPALSTRRPSTLSRSDLTILDRTASAGAAAVSSSTPPSSSKVPNLARTSTCASLASKRWEWRAPPQRESSPPTTEDRRSKSCLAVGPGVPPASARAGLPPPRRLRIPSRTTDMAAGTLSCNFHTVPASGPPAVAR